MNKIQNILLFFMALIWLLSCKETTSRGVMFDVPKMLDMSENEAASMYPKWNEKRGHWRGDYDLRFTLWTATQLESTESSHPKDWAIFSVGEASPDYFTPEDEYRKRLEESHVGLFANKEEFLNIIGLRDAMVYKGFELDKIPKKVDVGVNRMYVYFYEHRGTVFTVRLFESTYRGKSRYLLYAKEDDDKERKELLKNLQ